MGFILERQYCMEVKHGDENFMKDREIHGVGNVWSTPQRLKRSSDLMFMLVLNETMDQLAMANSVRWYGHALRRKDDHVLRRAPDLVAEGKRKIVRPKRTWKTQVEEEHV